jgi:hypothetical protein
MKVSHQLHKQHTASPFIYKRKFYKVETRRHNREGRRLHSLSLDRLVAIPKKSGDVRLCVGMCLPNAAIQRERHPTSTINDLVDTLNGAMVFPNLIFALVRISYH